jgi:hypothetical protein
MLAVLPPGEKELPGRPVSAGRRVFSSVGKSLASSEADRTVKL